MGVLTWLLMGLVVGAIARFLVRGRHNMGCIGTIALGLIGSLVGGTLANLLAGNGFDLSTTGFLGSVIGAVVILAIVSRGSR